MTLNLTSTTNVKVVERYRHAIAEKSRAEEYRRTAVQHCDTYRAIHRLNYWTQEVKDALSEIESRERIGKRYFWATCRSPKKRSKQKQASQKGTQTES
jgi:hypothetical protein